MQYYISFVVVSRSFVDTKLRCLRNGNRLPNALAAAADKKGVFSELRGLSVEGQDGRTSDRF